MTFFIRFCTTLMGAIFFFLPAFAGPESLSYQGRILDSSSNPMESSSVVFRFTLLSPDGTCELWTETKSAINMTGSGGIFDLTIGPSAGLATVLENGTNHTCLNSGNYTGIATAGRQLKVEFNPGSTGWREITPNLTVNSVPYASVAAKLGNMTAGDFIARPGTCSTGQSVYFDGTNFVCQALVAGDIPDIDAAKITTGTLTRDVLTTNVSATNGQFTNLRIYDGVGQFITMNYPSAGATSYTIRWPAVQGAASTVLQNDGAGNLSWAASGGGSGTVTSVTSTNAYLSVATGTTTPAITANIGTTTNTLAAGDDARFGQLQGRPVSATLPLDGQALLWDNGLTTWRPEFIRAQDLRNAWGGTQMIPAVACAANESMSWSVVTDRFTCQAIGSLNASAITAGTLAIAQGGTGAATANAAINNLLPNQATNAGRVLATDGTNSSWVAAPVNGGTFLAGDGTIALPSISFSNDPDTGFYSGGSGSLNLTLNGIHAADFNNSNFLMHRPQIATNGNLAQPSYGLGDNSSSGTGMFSPATNAIGFSTQATERARIDDTGLGLGVNAPSSRLDINGAVTMREMVAPTLSPADQGRIYFDSTSNRFRVSENGGAYVDLLSSGGVTGTGTTNFIPKWSSATGLTDSVIREVSSQVSIGGAAVGAHAFSVVGGNAIINGVSVGISSGGTTNTLLGQGALNNNVDAGNTAIGRHALASNVAGQYNTSVGYNSMESNQGSYNVAIGSDSMNAAGSASGNTALGNMSLFAVTSGNNNVGLGQSAGANITSGSENVIIGNNVNAPSATGNFQLNIGNLIYGDMTAASRMVDVNGALNIRGLASAPSLSASDNGKLYYDNTDDRLKVSLNGGAYANVLTNMSGFNANQAIVANGSGVASSFTCGIGQVLGFDASGFAVCTNVITNGGTFLAGAGSSANPSISFSGDSNTGFFSSSDGTMSYSSNGNTRIDFNENYIHVTVPVNYHGFDASVYTSTSGSDAYPAGPAHLVGNNAGGAGTYAGLSLRSHLGTASAYIGAVTPAAGNSSHIVFGQQTGASAYAERMRISSDGNVGIGSTSPGAMLQLGTAGTSLGTMRLTGNTSGFVQIQPAAAAGSWNMTLPANDGDPGQVLSTDGSGVTSWVTAGGATTLDALTDVITNYGAPNNMYLGSGVGANTTTGASNTGLGSLSLQAVTSGYNNTAYGNQALQNLTTGFSNVAIGREALAWIGAGERNTAVGMYVMGGSTSGNDNVAVGNSALTDANSSENTAIGSGALGTTLTAGANTALGFRAGQNATGASGANIFIGNLAGPSSSTTISDTLWIHNWSGNPTIYGDLANRRIGLGGMTNPSTTLDINGAITQRGMAAPSLSPAGQGRMYFDSTSNTFRVSQNGGAYANLPTNGGTFLSAAGTAGAPGFGFSGDPDTGIFNPYANAISFTVGGNDLMGIDSSGLHVNSARISNVGGPNPLYPNYTFGSDEDTGIYNPAVNALGFTSSGVERMRIASGGQVSIGNTSTAHALNVTGSAGLSTGTAWTNTSDARLKDVHGDYEYGLSEILKLNTVRFNYKKNNPLQLSSEIPMTGFVAQEVQKVIPDAVTVRKDGYLELNVDPIHWATVNAVQDLYGMCQASSQEIQQIKAENQELKKKIEQLEKNQNETTRLLLELKKRLPASGH